jgi:hypothetical protein
VFGKCRRFEAFSGVQPAAVPVLAALLAVLAGLALLATRPAAAAEAVAAVGSAAEDAEPEDAGPFRVVVFGDSLADGIWAGVYRTLRRDDRFEVERVTRVSSGLSRPDFFDWQAALDEYLLEEEADAVIISLGLNDAQPIFHEGRWDHAFGTEPWTEIYRSRVDAFMARLAEAGVPAFWVGLPTVRSDSFAERVAHLNEIYASLAPEHDVVFVPTREITADEDGRYSAYLADAEGRSRLMRDNDGIHFTSRGYELLGRRMVAAMRETLPVFRAGEDADAAGAEGTAGPDDADE